VLIEQTGGDHLETQMVSTKVWKCWECMKWPSEPGPIGWKFMSTVTRPVCFSLACHPPMKGIHI